MRNKYFLIFIALIAFIFVFQNSFGEIILDSIVEDDGLKGPVMNDPVSTLLTSIKVLAWIFVIPGLAGFYFGPCLGIYLLSKKYSPSINPVFSWIPFINFYPLTKTAGISGWWSLSFLVPILPVYVFMKLARKLKRGLGTTLGFFFLPQFTIPYVGLQESKKPTWPAWIFGLSSIIIVVIFFALILVGAVDGMVIQE